MKKFFSPVSVILIVLVVIGAMVWGSYNRLIGLEEGVDSAWSQVENVYQRRADLIPNLIKTVEGARDFEQETLQNVVEARSKAGQASVQGAPTAEQMQAFQANQEALGSALSRLLVVVERYPDLKATEAFRDLQRQLEGAENRIAVERRRFNEVSREFNTTRRRFPSNLVANFFGFTEKPYFQAAEGAEKPPAVDFSQK
jgi:LemA protein